MNYLSTRGDVKEYSGAEVILQGIAADGGLFVPSTLPQFSHGDFMRLKDMPYWQIASEVFKRFFDFSERDIENACREVYHEEVFTNAFRVDCMNKYSKQYYLLELWHGPSASFKDVALQMFPQFLSMAKEQLNDKRQYKILNVSSGDTGAATAKAFEKNKEHSLLVFYPANGPSTIQEKQMLAAKNAHIQVYPVHASFDQMQEKLKIFLCEKSSQAKDMDVENLEAEKSLDTAYTIANSVNWARIACQIVYYISSYVYLLRDEELAEGEAFDVVVPTGNFGNLLSAWYAKYMNVPIATLFCANNRNHALADFFRNGIYDVSKKAKASNSPAMDIVYASNLERLLFEVFERDSQSFLKFLGDLEKRNSAKIPKAILQTLQNDFRSAYADDQSTSKCIVDIYDRFDFLVDPHTAVGFFVYERNTSNMKNEEKKKTVFVSTASPLKFPETMVDALYRKKEMDGLSMKDRIHKIAEEAGIEVPPSIENLFEDASGEDEVKAISLDEMDAILQGSADEA